jgi:hypothetical protein
MCIFCQLSRLLLQVLGRNSEFSIHMKKAEIEFLEGIKALIEKRIRDLQQETQKKDFTKITIQE